MNKPPDFAAWIVLAPALLVWLLPGLQVARRLALPCLPLSAFLLSACGWFSLVLGLQVLGLPLTRAVLLPAWALAGLAASAWLWRKPRPPRPAPTGKRFDPACLLWLAPVAVAAVSVAGRALLDPLHGWDTSFRWDYLARAVLARGHLGFYPPVSAQDYEIYAWPDGIPPLASLLNLWVYLGCDSSAPGLLLGRLLGETALAGGAVFMLARSLRGPGAGWPALAVLAACPLFLWSVSMGQETGLASAGICALAYYLSEYRLRPEGRLALCAGLAAAVAALSRDYLLAVAGLGALFFLRRPRMLAMYLLPLAATAAPWYLRNWVRTGNPVFPHAVGGLFPGHPVLSELLHDVSGYWSFSAQGAAGLRSLVVNLAFLAGLVLLAGLAGLRLRRPGQLATVGLLALVVALWAWSATLTAGGWNYSLRVLAPAAGLLAALAGWLDGLGPRLKAAAACVLLLGSLDAARRSWLLPMFPASPVLPYSFQGWRDFRTFAGQLDDNPLWPVLARVSQGEVVLVDTTVAHTLVGRAGGRATTLFSPAAAPCFDREANLASALPALRAAGIRIVVLSVNDPVARRMLRRHPVLRELAARPPTWQRLDLNVYDLSRIDVATLSP